MLSPFSNKNQTIITQSCEGAARLCAGERPLTKQGALRDAHPPWEPTPVPIRSGKKHVRGTLHGPNSGHCPSPAAYPAGALRGRAPLSRPRLHLPGGKRPPGGPAAGAQRRRPACGPGHGRPARGACPGIRGACRGDPPDASLRPPRGGPGPGAHGNRRGRLRDRGDPCRSRSAPTGRAEEDRVEDRPGGGSGPGTQRLSAHPGHRGGGRPLRPPCQRDGPDEAGHRPPAHPGAPQGQTLLQGLHRLLRAGRRSPGRRRPLHRRDGRGPPGGRDPHPGLPRSRGGPKLPRLASGRRGGFGSPAPRRRNQDPR